MNPASNPTGIESNQRLDGVMEDPRKCREQFVFQAPALEWQTQRLLK